MTPQTTPMRGFLVRRGSGEIEELPASLVGLAAVRPSTREQGPGEPADFTARDLYDRHLLPEENVYVYVSGEALAADALLNAVRPAIRKRLGLA